MIVLKNDGREEYIYNMGRLKRSQDASWAKHCRGDTLFEIDDDGNNIIVNDKQTGGRLNLDASSFCELYYAMTCFLSERENFHNKMEMFSIKKVGEI